MTMALGSLVGVKGLYDLKVFQSVVSSRFGPFGLESVSGILSSMPIIVKLDCSIIPFLNGVWRSFRIQNLKG